MGRIRKKSQGSRSTVKKSAAGVTASPSSFLADRPVDFAVKYAEACGLATQGKNDEARRIYLELDAAPSGVEGEVRLRALVRSDLAALSALEGRFDEALAGFRSALEIDPDCLMARLNRDLIETELSMGQMGGDVGELRFASAPSHQGGGRWPAGPDGGAGASDSGSRMPGFLGPPPPGPSFNTVRHEICASELA